MISESQPNRIVVIGGGGKTSLAAEIAGRLGLRHVELDDLFWEPDWVQSDDELFRFRVSKVVAEDAWVIDGNYSRSRDVVWSRAELFVWLDYSRKLVLWRILKRSLARSLRRERIWSSRNLETVRNTFLSRDSLLLWYFQTYPARKRSFAHLFRTQWVEAKMVRLRSPSETKAWLAAGMPSGTHQSVWAE